MLESEQKLPSTISIFQTHATSQQLSAWTAGFELPFGEREWIESHLELCETCRTLASQVPSGRLELLAQRVSKNIYLPPVKLCEGYEIMAEAGRGATGIVYRASHRGLNRLVALKVLHSGVNPHPREVSRFRREAAALSRLDHPNIVKILDVGEQDGIPFIAMEWLDGVTLDEYQRQTVLKFDDVALMMASLADGIQHAHEHGVMHRDLKPQNVMMSAGNPRIVDFGLARFHAGGSLQTRTGAVLGTPSYAAPEQVSGESEGFGPATDIYGLGAIMYELLVGRPPFLGGTPMETLQMVREREPISITTLRPVVPRDLAVICHRCLEKRTVNRFLTASDLAADLRRYLDGLPIQSRPVSAIEWSWRWARRHPWPMLVILLVAISTAALIITQSLFQSRLTRERDQAVKNYNTTRNAVWEILNAVQSDAGFDIPRLNELRDIQSNKALELFESLAEAENSFESARDLASIRMRMGTLLLSQAKTEEARENLELARHGFLSLMAQFPNDTQTLSGLINSQVKMAVALQNAKKESEAIELLQTLLPVAEQFAKQNPNDPVINSYVAWIHHTWGNALVNRGEHSKAIENFKAAVATGERVLAKSPSEKQVLTRIAESQSAIGLCQMTLGDSEADASYRKALDTLQTILSSSPRDINTMYAIATSQLNRSNLMVSDGKVEDAISALSAGINIMERALQAAPDNAVFKNLNGMLHANRALYRGTQDDENALKMASDDWRASVNIMVDASMRDYSQTMLVRVLAKLNQVEDGKVAAQGIAFEQLDDSNLFRYAACWGTLSNSLASASGQSDAQSDATMELCLQAIHQSISELQRRKLLNDNQISQAIRTSDDFRTFRASISEAALQEYFE